MRVTIISFGLTNGLAATAGFRVCGMLAADGPPRLITNIDVMGA